MYRGLKVADKAAQPGFMESLPKTRAEALTMGKNQYNPGLTCPAGHTTYYVTSTARCAECVSIQNAAKADRQYTKAWRKTEKGAASIKAGKVRAALRDPKWNWAVGKYTSLRVRAEKLGVAFDLTTQDIYDIAPDTCPVFGTPLLYYGAKKDGLYRLENIASVDRKRATGGYTKDNVAVISMKANTIKSDATLDELNAVVRWMENY